MKEPLIKAGLIPVNEPSTFGDSAPEDSEQMTVMDVPAMTAAPDPARSRPSVKRLLQGDGANLISFRFAPGQELPDHKAAHPITVQCLSGTLDFTCGDERVRMLPGTVIHLRDHVIHAVECPADAEGDAVLLLTMLTGERHQH